MLLRALLCSTLLAATAAHLDLAKDTCLDVTVKDNFLTAPYLGRWYQWANIPNRIELPGDCTTVSYSPEEEPLTFHWINRWQSTGNNGSYHTMEGTARLVDDSGEAKILVSLPFTSLEANYWVLDTDYDNYAVVYGCNQVAGDTYVSSWILTRTPTVSPDELEPIFQAVMDNDMDPYEYVLVRHDADCTYDETALY